MERCRVRSLPGMMHEAGHGVGDVFVFDILVAQNWCDCLEIG